MYKRGSGTARVRDVIFSGSTLDLEEGGLTLAGHLNLGADGTLTVHDESRLTIEVGDITVNEDDHGRITAGGGVIYEGLDEQESPELFMQIGADAADNRDAIQARLQQEGTAIEYRPEFPSPERLTEQEVAASMWVQITSIPDAFSMEDFRAWVATDIFRHLSGRTPERAESQQHVASPAPGRLSDTHARVDDHRWTRTAALCRLLERESTDQVIGQGTQ